MNLDELKSECATLDNYSAEYASKQMHKVPNCSVVDRDKFILTHCKNKVILDIGASGVLHDGIVAVAKKVYGIDREDGKDIVGINLDKIGVELPRWNVDLVVCGEIIEHLGNPLYFLQRLRWAYLKVPVIITVPNAFSEVALAHMKTGIENVNIDHVAWYSWRTLTTLLDRVGYQIKDRAWYKGKPGLAEGLIAVVV